MAAISTTLLTFLSAGDHIVTSHAIYGTLHKSMPCCLPLTGGSHNIIELLVQYGIEVSWAKDNSIEEYAKAIKPNTKVLYAETPCNPNLR